MALSWSRFVGKLSCPDAIPTEETPRASVNAYRMSVIDQCLLYGVTIQFSISRRCHQSGAGDPQSYAETEVAPRRNMAVLSRVGGDATGKISEEEFNRYLGEPSIHKYSFPSFSHMFIPKPINPKKTPNGHFSSRSFSLRSRSLASLSRLFQ